MPGVLSVIRRSFLINLMHKLSVANWASNKLQVSYHSLSFYSYTNCRKKWKNCDLRPSICQHLQFQQCDFVLCPIEPDHIIKSYGAGTGPIYLSQLSCHGSEATLLECGTFARATGIHDCDHKDDVGVLCQGNTFCISISFAPQ